MAEKKKTFEEAVARLEEITASLEKGDAPLDAALSLFEEGTKLAAQCANLLDKAEQKVRILTRSEEGEWDTKPLEVE